ncbi:Nramp family divalent metal transporter [Micropruina sp.]|uniref:Nramp family divalent metal transporter n=1 Tax=Micropruina sp. TaxID=2737536 RepID=UPI0039E3FE5B
MGPAFVASVAYVDPGNVAANLTAGSRYGYALVWVLVAASGMAMLIQYQSAKLGLVTGRTLPQLMHARLEGKPWRGVVSVGYGVQAFVIAVATDLAEVVGGALALYLMFGTPLWLGGLIVGAVSVWLLWALRSHGERTFEIAITAILALICAGFLGALLWAPPDWRAAVGGLAPGIPAADAWPLVAAMLGATVMPHAIYLHSALAIDRHRPTGRLLVPLRRLLRIQKADVVLALLLSGSVNIGMLLLAAAALRGQAGDTIEAAFATITEGVGSLPALVFAVGLLASGVGSAVVGTHAGSRILKDLIGFPIAPTWRRIITVGPAMLLLTLGAAPTEVLVWSQVVLSFGVALAAAPLADFTGDRRLMGEFVDPLWKRLLNWAIVATIVALNVVMIGWTLSH